MSAAFFDLDRTLMAGSSGFHWARAAARAGLIPRRQLAQDAWANLQFRLQGSTDAGTKKLQGRVGSFITGRSRREFQRLAPTVLAGVLPRLYPRMLDVAYAHQDAGRKVYICTAASDDTATMLAHVLGFDGGLGTVFEMEEDDDTYTGRVTTFCYGEGKVTRMLAEAAQEGFSLDECWAYSDSGSDLPMLRAVGHPVVVNPDEELRRAAREEGWAVMRFETLGRSLKVAAGFAAVASAGYAARSRGGGTTTPTRRLSPRR